jgi:serine/threonine protein kinase
VAPEIIEMEGGGIASDVWSLGCTVIELLTGQPPYFELSTMQALFNIVEDKHPPIPDGIGPVPLFSPHFSLNTFTYVFFKALKHFLANGCFIKDPKRRPTAADLLNHPFILAVKDQVHPTFETLTKLIRENPANAGKSFDKPASSAGGSLGKSEKATNARASLNNLVMNGPGAIPPPTPIADKSKEASKPKEAASSAGDSSARKSEVKTFISPRDALNASSETNSVRARSGSSIDKEVSELQGQLKKVTKERDQYKRENEELKRQLEVAQRELAQLKINGNR